jgi:heme exporter protein D
LNESDAIYSWQAVAVALINMVGAVIMAFFRERTNQIRMAADVEGKNVENSRKKGGKAVKNSADNSPE